ncbi:hypothetical protein F511_01031 [Dorcoceras hygrometricum]|uniref:Uncharacterized protein n=1 Tax=Dorcoceras hygrometricum TaxID=472368 RepID=A0A2Z7AM37_9LAMI|nr:hypothetical protein F511_01031 [Dorcoceras hygrometricum]
MPFRFRFPSVILALFEKEKAVARFNRFRRIVKLWQFFELLVVLGIVSWSSARVPAVIKLASGYLVELSAYVFNHHVVFIVGNIIIVLLFVICRQNDSWSLSGDGMYDDYVKHSEAVNQREPPPSPVESIVPAVDEEKQIVVCSEEIKTIVNPQRDEVSTAIQEATRQIRRFQRTQSEKLKREIAVRPRLELRRSETEKYQRTEESETESFEASEIDTLSSEEFRRTVEAFIDKHWIKKSNLPNQFEKYGDYHLKEGTPNFEQHTTDKISAGLTDNCRLILMLLKFRPRSPTNELILTTRGE